MRAVTDRFRKVSEKDYLLTFVTTMHYQEAIRCSVYEEINKSFDRESYKLPGELKVRRIEGAAVMTPKTEMGGGRTCQGGVVGPDHRFVPGSTWFASDSDVREFDDADIPYEDSDVLFLGNILFLWGHTITDGLKNAWPLIDRYKDKLEPYDKIVYLSPNYGPDAAGLELFGLLGVDLSKCEHITDIKRFRSVQVPEASFVRYDEPGNKLDYWTDEYRELTRHIAKTAVEKAVNNRRIWPEKVYFTRTRLRSYNRRDYGEKLIEREMKRQGYAVVSPEKHSVAEQIAYLQNCRAFASTEGSVSHNRIFLPDETPALVIKKIPITYAYSRCIDDMHKNDEYLDCSLSLYDSVTTGLWAGPFFIYPNKQFCERFSLERRMFPFKEFKRYIKGFWQYLKDNPEERLCFDAYYRKVLVEEQVFAFEKIGDGLRKLIPFSSSKFGKRVVKYLQGRIFYLIA